MKSVWILNHYAQEPSGPGGTRHWSLGEHLREHGWQALIVAASVELQTGRQRLADHESSRLEVFGTTPFLWLRVPTYRGNGGGRVANMAVYALRAAFVRPGPGIPRPDVVIGSSVHPLAALIGWVQARRHGVPFVFEVRDLWPQTLIDLGRITPRGATATAMRVLERFLYRRAARIVTLLPRAWEYVESAGVSRKRVEWIPNGVEPGTEPPAAAPSTGTCTFMYFGAHGEANGLDNLLHAMGLAQADLDCANIRLRLVGDGPCKESLRALAADLGLTQVSFEPAVPKSAIPALAAQADAFVFNLVDAKVFRYGISSNKLFDYLCAARPIVFSCDAGNNPVSQSGAGVSVPPGNPPALLAGLRTIAGMSVEARARMGSAGRDWVKANHSWKMLSHRLARVLDAVSAEHRRG
jgi:glycosyltransferase involved in cell wall biosynthesis